MKFQDKKKYNIFLVGEKSNDVWVYGSCDRISPEAPVIIHRPKRVIRNDGMAGNVKSNIQSLSPDSRINFFHQEATITKTRHIDEASGQHLIRIDEDNDAFESDCWLKIIDALNDNAFGKYDAVVISDYGKGFLSTKIIGALGEICSELKIPTFLDTKAILGEWSKTIDFVKINEKEYNNQLSSGVKNPWSMCKNLLVTRGKNGIDLYDHDGSVRLHSDSITRSVWSVAGAGDTVLAAFVVRYLETRNIKDSMDFSMKAASIAVSRPGVVSVSRQDVNKI